ncbi:polyprenyl synthetase family protein [Halolamina sp.]|jgi:geranylgeranyl diphosphate synthase type I|uniref:polyprenyl synthetase family protein n=1 Tax=Halolamina sp. TaxID=1940283 RepID=UPI000223BB6A|nr:Polyprenyl synthetase [halophilic archaeon DL31]
METLDRRVDLVDERLEALVDDVEPPVLAERLRHITLSGGKRVRPAVTLLSCEATGGNPEDAVEFALGVELVHNASLVVDDIIDRSAIRRGTPSAWAAFGYGPAIVASDGLLGEAFALFSADEHAMQIVAEAMSELGEGEATELVARPTNEAEYMELARRKTGALFRAAAEVGAVAAGANGFTIESMGEYAERVGIAFQMRDDVLDATGESADLGKPAGQDAEMDRPSVIQVTDLSAEEANERAQQEADKALAALETATVEDSEARQYLEQLAEYVVTRER